jgi:hypothetical protein
VGRGDEVGAGVNVGVISFPALHPDRITLDTIRRIAEDLVFIVLSSSDVSFTMLLNV